MSEYGTINATRRSNYGKGAARQLRRKGLVPAVMYGQGADNVALSIDPHLFHKATDPDKQYNTLFQVTIEGEGQAQPVPCMIVDIQRDAIKDHLLHVDFLRVDPEQEVQRKVPVRYFGRAAGVMKGGKLKTFRRMVKVAAKPAEVPVELAIDLGPLDAGQSLRIKDVSLPGARILERADDPLALVEMPKAKKDEEEAGKKGKK